MDLNSNLRGDGESRVVKCRYSDVSWHGQDECAGVVTSDVLASSARYSSLAELKEHSATQDNERDQGMK